MNVDFKPVLWRADMRRLDEATIAAGTPSIELMERAGRHVASFLETNRDTLVASGENPRLLVLAGAGNNGGDGFVVARLLSEQGWEVVVALGERKPRPESDAARNLARWVEGGGNVTSHQAVLDTLRRGEASWTTVADALYGTGLERPLTGLDASLVAALNESGLTTIAIDVPSGLCADSGRPLGAAVVADATVTLGAAKPGLFVGVGPNHSGHVVIADIGLLDPLTVGIRPVGQVLDTPTCALWMPRRHAMTHKGDLGHVLVVGGQCGKVGAVLLAARGALRAGAGLVTMALPRGSVAAADAALAEAMTLALPETEDGQVAGHAWDTLAANLDRFRTIVVGPGLGTGTGARRIVEELIGGVSRPLVVDADGLNVVARLGAGLDLLLERRCRQGSAPIVFTPHPGEMARLIGGDVPDVQNDRLGTVKRYAAAHSVTVVLKGAATIVGDGDRIAFNSSGNPGMAAPGMGDVLSGVLGALLARVADPFVAASLGVYLHGLAGDILAGRLRAPGFFAGEVADALPHAIAALDADA